MIYKWTEENVSNSPLQTPSNLSTIPSTVPLSLQKQAFDSYTISLCGALKKDLPRYRVEPVTAEDEKLVRPLKRLYLTFVDNIQALLRTCGLNVLSALRFRRRKLRSKREPIKIVNQNSDPTKQDNRSTPHHNSRYSGCIGFVAHCASLGHLLCWLPYV